VKKQEKCPLISLIDAYRGGRGGGEVVNYESFEKLVFTKTQK
jgi:hypothetical protein